MFRKELAVTFYPRDAMLARVIAIVTCLSVCPSVRPSRAGIVSKRRKLASSFLHHLIAPFSDANFHHQILRGSPERGLKQGWGGKNQPFSSFKCQYLENVADTAKVTISD